MMVGLVPYYVAMCTPPCISVDAPHKISYLSDGRYTVVTSAPSVLTAQCLAFVTLFATFKKLDRRFLYILPHLGFLGGPSGILLLDLDFCFGHLGSSATYFRQ